MKLKTFFDGDFKSFSIYDCQRSIPSLIDGLKTGQRKAIYGMVKRGEGAGEMKVAQAAAYISSVTDYHHGERSMEDALVGLAQDFAGANNMNFLSPEGQFGSRLTSEAASSRYIFTKLHPNFRKLFLKEDDCILDYLTSDGEQIEPKNFIPLLPTVLINGSSGVGTGYASNILSYRPEDLKTYTLDVLSDKDAKTPQPWFRGFKGTVEKEGDNKVEIRGKLEVVNSNTIRITELPIGTFLDKYKTILNRLEEDGLIKSYKDMSNEDTFNFELKVPRTTTELPVETLMVKFKLITKVTENFTLWNENGNLQKFKNVDELMLHFIMYRLGKYEQRRLRLIAMWKAELAWLEEKIRFIEFYIENSTKISKMKKVELQTLLGTMGFTDIDRLFAIRVYNLTGEEIEKLRADIEALEARIRNMEQSTADELYKNDLKEFKP
jgi:DNA topoisomerase II